MSEEFTIHEDTVQLIGAGGKAILGVFSWDEADECCTMTLRYANKELTATEDDYFEAMCSIRKNLEADGLIPHCYGASRSTFPSKMGRNMGSGLQVYKLKQGQLAKTADLVSLFAGGPDVETVTVAEQTAFYKSWLDSLRQRAD